jgi:hypothetical protein
MERQFRVLHSKEFIIEEFKLGMLHEKHAINTGNVGNITG